MKTPEEIADEIVETANDATRIVDGAHSCPAGHDDEDVDYFCCGCLRSMISAAISAERKRAAFSDPIAFDVDAISAERPSGTVPPAPAPAPACARCGGSGEIRLYLPDEPDYHVTDPCPACRSKP